MKYMENLQINSFRAIFNGLTMRPTQCRHTAFATAIGLTSDENFPVAINRNKNLFVQYLEMLKGNALTELYYKGEEPGGNKRRNHLHTVDSINAVLNEMSKQRFVE